MYIPAAFAETDLATLHDFIEQHSFGLLVSQVEGIPFATHLPFLLDRQAGAQGTLVGHVARANPQWRNLAEQSALVVFSGPHAYVSPTWYEASDVVPTWNYVAAHVYGQAQIIDDEEGLRDIVERSVQAFERGMPQPWSLGGADVFLKRMLAQIVGFRIEIASIEGKWKLNQNHPPERREKVVRALQGRGDEQALAVATLMQASLSSEIETRPRAPQSDPQP
jgi:transcriptional regulator